MTKYQKIILIISILISSITFGQDTGYIKYLFSQEQYNYARSELYRLFYLSENFNTKATYLSCIGYSYQLEGDNLKAIKMYSGILSDQNLLSQGFIDSVKINLCMVLFESEQYNSAFSIIEGIEGNYAKDFLHKMSILTAEKNDLPKNKYTPEQIASFKGLKSSLKNPTTASILSAILPGAGQFYSNHYVDGLQAFFTVSVGVLFSIVSVNSYLDEKSSIVLPTLTIGTTLIFHYANIISGYKTGLYRNMKIKNNFLHRQMADFQPLDLLKRLQ